MSPDRSWRRPTHLPPADIDKRALHLEPGSTKVWLRLHAGTYPAVDFNRRPGNRFTPANGSCPVLYAGVDLETCLLEKFGDALYTGPRRIARGIWESRLVTALTTRAAAFLDLMDVEGLSTVGVDLSSLLSPELQTSQAWAKVLMDHPQKPDGLIYPSRFTNRACLALFQRVGANMVSDAHLQGTLKDIPAAAEFLDRFSIALV